MEFKSCSQAGQDKFVWEVTGHKTNGTFLDIGSGEVTYCSNTYALEQQGWRGLLMDLHRDADGLAKRKSPFLQTDSTTVRWLEVLRRYKLPLTIDFLSLDVDDATTDTLIKIPLGQIHFGVICIEHDSYRLGPGPRDTMREILKAAGYHLICEDVQIDYPKPGDTVEFEDWHVAPRLTEAAKPFQSKLKMWSDIVGV